MVYIRLAESHIEEHFVELSIDVSASVKLKNRQTP